MNTTEQMFALTVSKTFANECTDRQLNEYGSGFARIVERYEAGQRKPYKMKFTAEEVAQLKKECEWVVSRDCDWDSYLKASYRGLLRQIARVVA